MKVENYQSAVEYYTQAIDLNPNNAVYFCNRYDGKQFCLLCVAFVSVKFVGAAYRKPLV